MNCKTRYRWKHYSICWQWLSFRKKFPFGQKLVTLHLSLNMNFFLTPSGQSQFSHLTFGNVTPPSMRTYMHRKFSPSKSYLVIFLFTELKELNFKNSEPTLFIQNSVQTSSKVINIWKYLAEQVELNINQLLSAQFHAHVRTAVEMHLKKKSNSPTVTSECGPSHPWTALWLIYSLFSFHQ